MLFTPSPPTALPAICASRCANTCPYARFQSAMFDNPRSSSPTTASAASRAARAAKDQTPRPRAWATALTARCACRSCPTGIDIRNGLQYECIGCGLCVDACNNVMDKGGSTARSDPLCHAKRHGAAGAARQIACAACCAARAAEGTASVLVGLSIYCLPCYRRAAWPGARPAEGGPTTRWCATARLARIVCGRPAGETSTARQIMKRHRLKATIAALPHRMTRGLEHGP